MDTVAKEYIERLPKAELHLHLEGSITAETLAALAKKYSTEMAGIEPADLRKKYFEYDNFQEFLSVYRLVCEHLREPDDYILVLDSLAGELARQNVFYAEILYAPSIPWKWDRDAKEVLAALTETAARYEKEHGLLVRWILDCVRQFDKEAAERTAELAGQFQDAGVVGLGMGGDENARPLEEFEEVFTWARAHGLFVHAHAGETGEPQQVWDALQILGAGRIGHGIQAARDSKLMEYLRDRAVGLDVCLTSNARTRVWPVLSDHPFRLLLKRGVPVTLNTDDPGLFDTTLCAEYEKATELFGLTTGELQYLSLQGIRSSFLPHEKKMRLMEVFNGKIQEL